MRDHFMSARTPGASEKHRLYRWFNELSKAGTPPVMRVIFKGCVDWDSAERYAIKWFRENGRAELFNIAPGGAGYTARSDVGLGGTIDKWSVEHFERILAEFN